MTNDVKAMAKVYREGRLRFLAINPDAGEIETVEAGIAAVLEVIRAAAGGGE